MNIKIVFIISAVQDQRCIKRIDEFIDNGYQVEAFGFLRDTTFHTKPERFNVKIISQFSNSLNYFKRLFLFFKSLRNLIKIYKNSDVLFYYFGLDMAIFGYLFSRKKYIYEEADLSHTYLKSNFFKFILELLDKFIIKKSFLTVLTSEGFFEYHFGKKNKDKYSNVIIIPNKLNYNILNLKTYPPKQFNKNNIKIGFVGSARFKSILFFSKIFLENFPQHELHFYGDPIAEIDQFKLIDEHFQNVFFHGPYKNPTDLPHIYKNIDLVLSTYDVRYENVKYAEPNKLYEAIFFEVPIIVSKGTFLAEKVKKLNIGYAIDPFDQNEIINFINFLDENKVKEWRNSCSSFNKIELININTHFFNVLSQKLNSLK